MIDIQEQIIDEHNTQGDILIKYFEREVELLQRVIDTSAEDGRNLTFIINLRAIIEAHIKKIKELAKMKTNKQIKSELLTWREVSKLHDMLNRLSKIKELEK